VALPQPRKIEQWHTPNWRTAPWRIVGAGSIGCLFATYLQRAGIDVQLVLRDAAGLALWSQHERIGLQRSGHEELIAVSAIAPTQLSTPVQKLLVCTKAQQTHAAIAALQAAIAPNAVVILLQNGMGVREQIQELLPDATILHGLSTEGVYQTKRFHIVHAGHGETVIGALQPEQQIAAQVASTALQCELPIAAVDNIGERLWLKLAVNSVINPLTALHGCRNGELLHLSDIDLLLPALCAEVCEVANAEGQTLSTEQLVDNVRHVCTITANNRSSMLQDIEQQRYTEIDFINGYVLRRAAYNGISCSQQFVLFNQIKALEQKRGCH
jgi:2-dehydropantoate 2-reductase